MAQAVREERRADAGGDRSLGRHGDHAEVLQDAHQRVVGVHVQLPVVHAAAHAGAHLLLGGIHGIDHRLELAAGVVGVAAGDVAGIAVEAGAGVDQEAAQRVGRDALQLHVVQHRGVLVEADDVAVGQVIGVLAHRRAVGHVDAELAFPRAEGCFGGAVATHGQALRLPHQRDLVRRLVRTLVLQVLDHGFRIVRRMVAERALWLAEDGAARGRRQQGGGFVGRADDVDVAVVHPPAAGRVRYHVPVVERLVVDHLGPFARRVHQPAVGQARERQPGLELRIDRIRVVAVVEDLPVLRAAGHDQVVETAPRQRFVGTPLHRRQMIGVQRDEVGVEGSGGVHGGDSCGRVAILPHPARTGRGVGPIRLRARR